MTLLLFSTLATIGVLYALWPMLSDEVKKRDLSVSSTDGAPVLDQIADLDLEFAAGKIPEDSYRRIRDELVVHAAFLLKNATAP